ncbi:flagellar protein FlgN [Nocardioides sp. NPDC057772]|uniref:flagellar protein FlgN n=1 Tax=Nocardioides sp. NPDC057772 TaxID=3346245 RepID=UPI00366B9580
MADILIKIVELETVKRSLDSIVDEFENATDSSEDLEADIGDPFDRSELRDKACDFEERWDDKRNDLKDSLKKVSEHIKGVIDGIENWDSETALQFESK